MVEKKEVSNSCPIISVIVPVYNSEATLSYCVSSILRQTYRNLQVILVNDGSKDSSVEICKQIADTDNRIKVIDKPNGGPNSARNRGIEEAKGEYIVFVDSDDTFYSNDTLELNMKFFENGNDIDIVSFPQYREAFEENSNNIVLQTKKEQFKPEVLSDKYTIFTNWINGRLIDGHFPGKIFKKSLFNGWKLIESIRFTEDVHDIPKLCHLCRSVQISGVGGYTYKFNENSLIHTEFTQEKRWGMFLSTINIYNYLKYLNKGHKLMDSYYFSAIENAYYLSTTSYCKDALKHISAIKKFKYLGKGNGFTRFLIIMTSIFGLKNGFGITRALTHYLLNK